MKNAICKTDEHTFEVKREHPWGVTVQCKICNFMRNIFKVEEPETIDGAIVKMLDHVISKKGVKK